MISTKILVITPQYAPDFGPSAPIYTWLSEDLQRMGCEVTVVTAFPHYAVSVEKNPDYEKIFTEEELNGVRIIRTYVYTVPKSALWGRLLYHSSYNLFSTLASLRVRRPDIILADGPSLWSGLSLLIKAILPGVPFIYILHDIYPDVLQRLGVLNSLRLINWIERIEEFYYARSSQISVLSEGFKENLTHKGIPPEKITIIPACVDTEFIRPLPYENELREHLGFGGKYIILYAGNIGLSQGLETVLSAAKLLISHQEILFVLVGEGATKPAMQVLAEENGVSNVRFYPFVPREDVPFLYALADVCLVSLKRDIVIESVPSKTYTIMASCRPIIATVDQNTETGRLIDKTYCGLCVEPENPDALAQAILKLYQNPLLRDEMGTRGRNYVVEHFSRQVATNQYYELIQRYVGVKRR